MHRYSVETFSYSGISGILGSDGKQNAVLAVARGRETFCTFYYFSLIDTIKPSLLFSNIVGSLYF